MATETPSRASSRATALPMPRLPPVTMAVLPANSRCTGSADLRFEAEERAVYCGNQVINLRLGDRQRWRDQGVIADLTVGAALARIYRRSFVDTRAPEAERDTGFDREGLACGLVLHQLDTEQEPQSARIALDAMAVDQSTQTVQELGTPQLGGSHQVVPLDIVEHRQPSHRGDRVLRVSVAGHPRRTRRPQRVDDTLVGDQHRQWGVAAANALCGDENVRHHIPVFDREPAAAAPKPAHHFVGDEQHVVAVADFADALKIASRR